MKKYLLIFLISLICFGSYGSVVAQTPFQEIPLPEEEKTMVGAGIETLKKTSKEIFKIWKEFHQKVMRYWKDDILPKIQQWIEKKKPELREQFEKEKEELKKEISKTFSKFWKWLKDLIR